MDTLQTPCSHSPELFDADALDIQPYQTAVANNDDEAAEKAKKNLEQAVDDTISAITLCEHCPLLEICRNRTSELIKRHTPPTEIVQAGIYWGRDGRPDVTLAGCLTTNASKEIAAQTHYSLEEYRVDDSGQLWPLTVSIYRSRRSPTTVAGVEGPVHADLQLWDTTWLPPLPPVMNITAIEIVVTNELYNGIPEAKAACTNLLDIGNCEILSDSEICEVLRRMHKQGMTTRQIAKRVNLNPATVKNLCIRLGLPVKNSEIHRKTALIRERKKAKERERKASTHHGKTQPSLCEDTFTRELSQQ